jgi:hypothetical protein
MLDALQGKLDRLLAAGLTDEVRVLYFFIEGRKMLDRKPSYGNPDFRMFANWAAHIELAHNRAPHRKLLRAEKRSPPGTAATHCCPNSRW